MPIDYFSPSAYIFREAGAKPLNLIIILYIVINLIFGKKILGNKVNYSINVNTYLMVICGLGSFAFLLNYIIFDYPLSNRSPEYQFLSQLLMFILFIITFNGLKYIFSKPDYRLILLNIIPLAVFFHLLIFCFEFIGYFNSDKPGLLILFRNTSGLIDRASGLMSEPSYFGVFSGLFVMPLLLACKAHKILSGAMAFALVLFSVLIQAKTFFIVITIQLLFLLIGSKKTFRTKLIIGFIFMILVISGIYIISVTSVFNLEDNLSSAMRLGSNVLALNVSLSGYGLLGIGFGQFHFFYSPEYSPVFLLQSKEALDQMNNIYDTRASTFSLPIRLLVETGFFGLLTAITLIYKIFKNYAASSDLVTQTGLLFISGSIGFLLTQDSYCLPSLALGLALVVSQPQIKTNTSYSRISLV